MFIPSNDVSKVTEATQKLQKFLDSKGIKANITVATNYDFAATQLEQGSIDVAFLPVET